MEGVGKFEVEGRELRTGGWLWPPRRWMRAERRPGALQRGGEAAWSIGGRWRGSLAHWRVALAATEVDESREAAWSFAAGWRGSLEHRRKMERQPGALEGGSGRHGGG